jgi:cyanophycinase-like exopeptidase
LYREIKKNKRLSSLVMNSDFLIGESAGSTVCGEYRRGYKNNKDVITKGLGILKDTIIEAHYTERNRRQLLRNEMKKTKAEYGLGIDSITGVVINTDFFPQDCKVLGEGNVEILEKEDLFQ